jgi:hypothetical protein
MKEMIMRINEERIGSHHHSLQDDAAAGLISNAQLETVAYAMQRFYGDRLQDGSRGGFFLGDGAGVGKGRQIAALIKVMWLNPTHRTRRILWLSHNRDLREDARRDMVDVNINVPSAARRASVKTPLIEVWPPANRGLPVKGRIKEGLNHGVLFATYDLLRSNTGGVGKKCHNLTGACVLHLPPRKPDLTRLFCPETHQWTFFFSLTGNAFLLGLSNITLLLL